MITFAPFPEIVRDERPRPRPRPHVLPLVTLTTAALLLTTSLPGWARMWLIALALFAGFKWWTWRRVTDSPRSQTPFGNALVRATPLPQPGTANDDRNPAVAVDRRATDSVMTATSVDVACATLPRARRLRATSDPARSLAYLFLWPGMNARAFLSSGETQPSVVRATCCPDARSAQKATQQAPVTAPVSREPISREQEANPTAKQWTWAIGKTLLGATLLWVIARLAGHGLLAGWIGMIGLIFLLHFGLFALLALFWQSRGLDAAPLMNCPIAARSLHDFWGRRWNAGFRDIVFTLFFLPLARRFGAATAALFTFLLSGLIHELVITIPAGAGYGLPTLYFALQGGGLMLERKRRRAACTLTRDWPGRVFALAVVILPIFALFPPVFVDRVMVPFFQVIHAL